MTAQRATVKASSSGGHTLGTSEPIHGRYTPQPQLNTHSVITAHLKPHAPLSQFVNLLWYWDGYVQPHAQERLLPDGSLCIVFNLGEDRIRLYDSQDISRRSSIRGHVLCGAHSHSMVTDTRDMVVTLGIQFKPGGAFPFLPMPTGELNEQCVSLDDVFGIDARHLREQLLECNTPELKFAAVERWLQSRALKPLQRHQAVAYATARFLCDPLAQPLAAVLDRVGYSQRHFNQMFTDEVGLTPKRFLRVRRFQHAIEHISACDSVDWVDLALRFGYYDQSHFVHDFRKFCGLTPAAYLAVRTPHLNHLPVLD
jgi:AraC-like DNA-binding protein